MKEHGLFLEAGFPCKEKAWIRRADWFRQQFEMLLRDAVLMSDERVSRELLDSGELVTEYTIPAERRTEQLSGVAIDSRITARQQTLCHGDKGDGSREEVGMVHRMNQRALQLLDGLIAFKEELLREMQGAGVFNANYPLLIKHITREARLYREIICELLERQEISARSLCDTQEFWNCIMMEHALFIRGLLDPSENELISGADSYAAEYKELLEKAREKDCKAAVLGAEALETTCRFSEFKAAGAKGILECNIASVIMPLLADHVLREANHYIRLLQSMKEEECPIEADDTCSGQKNCMNRCEMPAAGTCNCRR